MVSPLTAKLLRDLWRIKGQAAAIAVVLGIGVAMQVMMTGLTLSLSETRDSYYERYRLADVVASAVRVPTRVTARLGQIDGVARIDTRITGAARIDTDGLPIYAQVLSLPPSGRPGINDILLTSGRALNPDHPTEAIVLNSYAEATGLTLGDRITATLNGVETDLTIVGTAQSPEFLFATAPGEMIPDDARFAVLWMSQSALAAAYDLEGAFNQALFTLTRDANAQAVRDAIDDVLAPYGTTGALDRSDLMSDTYISEEINGLRMSSRGVPPIFLGVAAFLLYIVISRLVQSEREEIGLMKAFGYRSREIGLHYMELVLTIALFGAALGCGLGIIGGRALVPVYTLYYKFPYLLFRLDPGSFLIGVGTSVAVASVGGAIVLRRIAALTPAEAMRPPTPPDYRRAGRWAAGVAGWLDQPSRMVLRRITRQPARMAGATFGIAAGMGLTLAMLTIFSGFHIVLDRSFGQVDRSDAVVSFAVPVTDRALFELGRVPGVDQVEPVRSIAARLDNGRLSHQGAITGLTNGGVLYRALDSNAQPIFLPEQGIVLSTALADLLDLRGGDRVQITLRTGDQPTVTVPVAAIADSLMGTPAYMNLTALNALLGQPDHLSGAYLALEPGREAAVQRALADMPRVAGVSLTAQTRAAFETVMDQGAGSVRYVMGIMAFAITFGIVYNAARVAQAERARDLASLRVIGFRRGEVAFVLLGELAVVVLAALPLGLVMGAGLSHAVAAGFNTELYQIPIVGDPAARGWAIMVVLGAAAASGLIVKRDLDRMDMISALKTRD